MQQNRRRTTGGRGASSDLRYEGTLLAFEEDVRSKSLVEWIVAHATGSKPLHRFEGVLEVSGQKRELVFTGRDNRRKVDVTLRIPFENILEVRLGFDEIFRMRDERSPWNKPLVVKFREGGKERMVYIFASFKRCLRTSQNGRLYVHLKGLLSGEGGSV